MTRHLNLVFAIVATLWASTNVRAGIILNFDDLPAGSSSGDIFSADGVLFRFGNLSGTVSVGALLSFDQLADGLEIVSGDFAISGANAASTFNGLDDNLMAFATPISRLSLVFDDAANETDADLVRLIALESTVDPLAFRVIDFVERLDNTMTIAENTMLLSPSTTFSFAVFQRTTEPESFDNLRISTVPEPSSFGIFAFAGLLLARKRRILAKRVMLADNSG